MGIKLDWEVELDHGTEAISEDPAVTLIRRRRARRTRRAVIAVALITVLGTIGVWARLKQVASQRREYLSATVAAETLALRMGDQREFMLAQAESEAWQQAQRQSFHAYQAISPDIQIAGDASSIEINGDEARVTVPVKVGGAVKDAVWVYTYTEEGWRHAATMIEPWGTLTRRTRAFDFVYRSSDQALVDALDPVVNRWWSLVCDWAYTCMEAPPHITILIDGDADAVVGWADDTQTTLVIPARTNPYQPDIFRQIAPLLAQRWTQHLLDRDVLSYESWVHEDMAAWMLNLMNPSAPRSEILGPLMSVYGPQFLPQFLTVIHEGDLGSMAISEARARSDPSMMRAGAGSPAPEQLEMFFLNYLRAEAALRAWEYAHNPADELEWHWQASLAFMDQTRYSNPSPDAAIPVLPYFLGTALPETMQITGMQTYGEITWVRVAFDTQVEPPPAAPTPAEVYAAFRYNTAGWNHTTTGVVDWEPMWSETRDVLTVSYYELDAQNAQGMALWLAGKYQQLAADFGMSEPRPDAQITITPMLLPNLDPGTQPDRVQVLVPTPYVACCLGDQTPQGYLNEATLHGLIRDTLAYRLNLSTPLYQNHPLVEGLIRWEYRRLAQTSLPLDLAGHGEFFPPADLESLWSRSLWAHADLPAAQANANILAGEALIETIAAQYGAQAIPALIDHLRTAGSLEDWLQSSVGAPLEDIEPIWRSRYTMLLMEMD